MITRRESAFLRTSLLLLTILAVGPGEGMDCREILEQTRIGLSKLRSELPTLEEISKIDNPETAERFIERARAWAKAQRKAPGKEFYCCVMPFYWPHKNGELCGDCPYPGLFAEGTEGADVSQRIIELIKKTELNR